MAGAPPPDTIDPGEAEGLDQARRGRALRRVVVGLLAAFVLLGLFGVFGYRQGHRSVEDGGYAVTLSYPAVSRGGLPSHWSLVVRRTDGGPLGQTVEVATTGHYFAAFDHNDLTPEPDASWQSDGRVRWTFEPSPYDTELRIDLDIRTQPDARWSYRATTTVTVDDQAVADLDYRTWVMP